MPELRALDDDRSVLELEFQNEFAAAWRDGEVIVTTPDIICVMDSESRSDRHRDDPLWPARERRGPSAARVVPDLKGLSTSGAPSATTSTIRRYSPAADVRRQASVRPLVRQFTGYANAVRSSTWRKPDAGDLKDC